MSDDTSVCLASYVNEYITPVKNGRHLRDTLESLGFGVKWKKYEDQRP
jgi:hypothetical protein